MERFPGKYEELGKEIGELVDQRSAAYRDAFNGSGKILRELYPKGIGLDQYEDALGIIHIIELMFKITAHKDAFGVSLFGINQWQNVAGHGIFQALRPVPRRKQD